MSRNLRGGNRGFNFAFGGGDSTSSDEETKEESKPVAASQGNKLQLDSHSDEEPPVKNKFKFGGFGGKQMKLEIPGDEEEKVEVANKRDTGDVGATSDLPDSEIFKQKKKNLFSNSKSKKPKMALAIDIEHINDLYNFGGEHGEMKEEEAIERLENDIQELAAICIKAMR